MMTCLAVWAPMRPLISVLVHRLAVVRAGDVARLAVDGDDDVVLFAVVLLGRRDERRLDRLKDDFLVDVLVAVERVDDAEDFAGFV